MITCSPDWSIAHYVLPICELVMVVKCHAESKTIVAFILILLNLNLFFYPQFISCLKADILEECISFAIRLQKQPWFRVFVTFKILMNDLHAISWASVLDMVSSEGKLLLELDYLIGMSIHQRKSVQTSYIFILTVSKTFNKTCQE